MGGSVFLLRQTTRRDHLNPPQDLETEGGDDEDTAAVGATCGTNLDGVREDYQKLAVALTKQVRSQSHGGLSLFALLGTMPNSYLYCWAQCPTDICTVGRIAQHLFVLLGAAPNIYLYCWAQCPTAIYTVGLSAVGHSAQQPICTVGHSAQQLFVLLGAMAIGGFVGLSALALQVFSV